MGEKEGPNQSDISDLFRCRSQLTRRHRMFWSGVKKLVQESASVIVNNVTSARLTSQAEQDEESALNVVKCQIPDPVCFV